MKTTAHRALILLLRAIFSPLAVVLLILGWAGMKLWPPLGILAIIGALMLGQKMVIG